MYLYMISHTFLLFFSGRGNISFRHFFYKAVAKSADFLKTQLEVSYSETFYYKCGFVMVSFNNRAVIFYLLVGNHACVVVKF
jgi:hypothetical protein